MKNPETHLTQPRLVNYLFKSDFYEIKNWILDFDRHTSFEREFNDCLCAVHIQRGTLTKKMYQLTTGHVTLELPDFEYQLLPSRGSCTIINFTNKFYAQLQDELQIDNLFKKQGKNTLSVQTKASPESEFVLFTILNTIQHNDCVQLDALVLDFLNEFLKTTRSSPQESVLHQSHNRHHQEAVEHAKEYLQANFYKSISLVGLSRYCGISLFYLSRLFKSYTNYSPHQYLLNVRLKHGEMLLKETSKSIVDITYASGFTSPEYFSTLFKRKYNQVPSSYRMRR
ncbi:helix-turn-helix transcriptional regulator [Chryseosolibacter indicus]|uniref:AraC family transcriptional regulator n=1 Tax=Chryseosolibacter indicus TaxID=2782351 RepID=A0ABS5VSN1_9BACT|nr:AraC family transcriptional regulator [Chryseosolibacter indicus]MBT1704440.1 AraC family transcriptional regulator [Chryseosolibacter indicus]